jgi:hypothetical protein
MTSGFKTIPALLAILLAVASSSPAATPLLNEVFPRGAQRGTEVEFTFTGDRLDDAAEVLFYEPGMTVSGIAPVDPKNVKIKITIAPDATNGDHIVRLRSNSGLSGAWSIWVGQYPNVDEIEPNSEFETPQRIELNQTILGTAQNEDVDYYIVTAKKGQLLSAEVEAMRLGRQYDGRFFDPYVAIMNKDRFEIALADDTPLLMQDCYASVVVPEDGDYVIQVRDASYEGSDRHRYRVHIGDFPRPAAVYPAGGKIGQERDFRLIGAASGEITKKTKLPDTATEKFPLFADNSPSPNYLRVSTFDDVLETEPNNNRNEATAGGELPFAFNGNIETPGDEDWFKFTAKKGQKYTVRTFARSIRSRLDSVVNVYKADGGRIEGNDDQGGPDSRFDFTAPEDGQYFVSVRDHLKNGGPDYFYRIEAEAPAPSLDLNIAEFARQDYQSRQMLYVPRGNRSAMVINITRSNTGGAATFEAPELPAGVTMQAQEIPGNVNNYPVVFEAAPDAPIAGRLMDLRVKSKDNPNLTGTYYQNLDFVIANPNQTVYYRRVVNKMAAAVVEEVPFKIDIVPPSVPLVQNGTIALKIKVTKNEGFDEKITLRMLWNPPGIGAPGTIELPKGQSEIDYALNANGNAEARTWPIAIMAESDGPKGPVIASSALTNITIEPPFVGSKIELAAVEQGKGGTIICKLEQLKPFEGNATIRLVGLPAKTEVTQMNFTKADTELLFPVMTATDTPNGQHKNIFCYVEIPQAGQMIPHNIGHGGVFRVDPPPPPKKDAPPKPKEEPKIVEAAPPAPPKPLSRLEKLRLEAKQKAEAQ